jgi:hypothetical protein
MGEAQAAVVDDATSVFWNPAGLMRLEGQSAVLMHGELLNGISYESLGYGALLPGDWGAVGAGLQYLSVPRISETDASGFETGTQLGPRDMMASLSYAHSFPFYGWEDYEFGVTGKYLNSKLSREASAYAADFGILSAPYRVQGRELRLALVVQNAGAGLKYDQETETLPLTVKLGSALNLTKSWLIAVDLNHPRDNGAYTALGTEYTMRADNGWAFAARAGLNTRTLADVNGLAGFTVGLGAQAAGWGMDYALVPLGPLGLSHRVSLSLPLGKPRGRIRDRRH